MKKYLILMIVVFVVGCGGTVIKTSNKNKNTDLVIAAFIGNLEQVKELIAAGAYVNTKYGGNPEDFKDDEGGVPLGGENWTPLLAVSNSHIAKNRVEIARVLLDAGADIDADDGYGATALYKSIYMQRFHNEYTKLAFFLIEKGANVNTKTDIYIDGAGDITPLHRAVNNADLVKALMAKGANVNAKDSMGHTVLHWAILDDNLKSASFLIKAGADTNVKDKDGKSPLSSLTREEKRVLNEYLQDHKKKDKIE
jgi:ankyrin repeat protein